jgi:tetratricopeptide (TPR) repeat protein
VPGDGGQQPDLFQELDEQTQEIKLRILDLNREVNKYAVESNSEIGQSLKGKNRAEFSLDFVFRDQENGEYLSAINRYHTGRDFGVILSKYETALRVANIYLDYGLYQYSKKIFISLLGEEDTAVASLARYYLAKHDYLKGYWDEALNGFESVRDGVPLDMLDKKRVMQAVILQNKKRHDEAISLLSEIAPSSQYYAYARFNMAMSHLRKGWWSDAEEIIQSLLKKDNSVHNLSPYLRDRFYIALGYSQLQRAYYREAYSSLKKVSAEGPYSYKAQLGLAIVAAEQEKYQESLKILENLKQAYAKQLVTEEAHIVTPFILESIGSLDITTAYYSNAIEHYQASMQEITDLQRNLVLGRFDHIVTSHTNTWNDLIQNPKTGITWQNEPINRFIYELQENERWIAANRNIRDLKELVAFLEELNSKLVKMGQYKKKTYNELSVNITDFKSRISNLSEQYILYLRQTLDEQLTARKNYFLSYLNQSQYALARIYDSALGSKLETTIAKNAVTEKEVRTLYRNYLDSATPSSHNRRVAMLRLAELEQDRYEQLIAEESQNQANAIEAEKRLATSIDLMTAALKDYPDHKNNDKLLYQLITAYDKQKQPEKAVTAMRQLVDNYPQSRFYTEIQFKLGEKYLTDNDSIDAELAYSAAIQQENVSSNFYWRALYKRGWSRLRQSVYEDALDDFFRVLEISGLAEQVKLSAVDRELYIDLIRAISLCFANMGGLENLNQYFKKYSDSPFAFLAYEGLGEMYESQQRVFDAVEVYDAYVKTNKLSPRAPEFLLKIIKAWQNAGQPDKELEARTVFETNYSITTPFWKKNDIGQFKNIREALEANTAYMASHYHGLYQKSNTPAYLQQAKYWYERFVSYDSIASNAAKTYFRYAELLTDSGEPDKALVYYEKSNKGDTDLTDKKEAAYAAVVTADNIYSKTKNSMEQNKWLLRKVEYTLSFIKDFPGDKRSPGAALNITENLYTHQQYKEAIRIIDQIPQAIKIKIDSELQLYKAHCLFALGDFKTAEQIYAGLYGGINSGATSEKLDKDLIADRLASSIYKQGEHAEKTGKDVEAVTHYLRVFEKAPGSKFAAAAEFDAANVLIRAEQFDKAVLILERFLKNFSGHQLQSDVNNKLAVIYLKQSDKQKSALAFERAFEDENNGHDIRRDALWQAAEMQAESGNNDKAVTLYERYIDEYSSYHESAMEAKSRLVGIYRQRNDNKNQVTVLQSMVDSEAKIRQNMSTGRTRYLAANAALELIERDVTEYKAIRIEQPLKETLNKKKAAMQNLVNALTKVTEYAIEETTTQAIYLIAEAYNEFSRAIVNSPRPAGLKDLELEQYELLLEEQAFPFEEKALTFYKENLKNIRQGVYNQWVKNSFEQLARLVPARYDKQEKVDAFIDVPFTTVNLATK